MVLQWSADYHVAAHCRLGPYERTKCVRCIACRDVRCRNRKKPIDLNIRGTRALLHGSHDVRWFSMGAIMLDRTSSRAEWRHSFVYPRMVPARRALVQRSLLVVSGCPLELLLFHLSLCFIVLLFLQLSVFYHGYLTDAMFLVAAYGQLHPPPAIHRQIHACRVVTSATSVMKYMRCNVRTSCARVAPAYVLPHTPTRIWHRYAHSFTQWSVLTLNTSVTTALTAHCVIIHGIPGLNFQQPYESVWMVWSR
jgi:hypothetical protein